MTFLAKGKKCDLLRLAEDLNVECDVNLRVIELKNNIQQSEAYKEDLEYVKTLFEEIIAERIIKEQRRKDDYEMEKINQERSFELEKLRLQSRSESLNSSSGSVLSTDTEFPRLGLDKLIPNFNASSDDISLFLNLFERQLTFLKIPVTKWVVYLVGLLPKDIAKLIAQESDENAQDYGYVKQILLKRFKMSAEKFRQLFTQHRRSFDTTWRDFYFDLQNFFDGWISGLGITEFKPLCDLMISDQIKRRVPPDVRGHFLDNWSALVNPIELVNKLDSYEEVRSVGQRATSPEPIRKEFSRGRQRDEYNQNSRTDPQRMKAFHSNPRNETGNVERQTVSCYGCGKMGVIKTKCPTCSSGRNEKIAVNFLTMYAYPTTSSPLALLDTNISGVRARVCADTGASRSIAGEILYSCLLHKGVKFKPTTITMTLANGCKSTEEACTALVNISIKEKSITLDILALPRAKGNRTLLGTDFLEKAGIVLNLKNRNWHFCENPKRKFHFQEDIPVNLLRPVEDGPKSEVSLQDVPEPGVLPEDIVASQIDEVVQPVNSRLREEEGEGLLTKQRTQLNHLIREFQDIFKPGGDTTPYLEHRIDTVNAPPVATTPYRKSPARQKLKVDSLELAALDKEVLRRQSLEIKSVEKEYSDYGTTMDKVNDLGNSYDAILRGESRTHYSGSPTRKPSNPTRFSSPKRRRPPDYKSSAGRSPLSSVSNGFGSSRNSADNLGDREKNLDAVSDDTNDFQDSLNRLQDRLQHISGEFDHLFEAGSDAEDQLRKLNALEEQLEDQRSLLADAEGVCEQLCDILRDSASRSEIKSKLNGVEKQYNNLNMKMNNRKAELESAWKEDKYFYLSFDRIQLWLNDMGGTLSHDFPISTDQDILKRQVQDFEGIYKQVLNKEHEVHLLMNKGSEMLPKVARKADAAQLQSKMDTTKRQWEKVRKFANNRYTQLQKRSENCTKYLDSFKSFLSWLSISEDKVHRLQTVSFQRTQLDKQVKETQAIKNDLIKHSQEFENTCMYGEVLISCCDIDVENIKDEIGNLKRRWDRLNHEVVERAQALDDVSHKLNMYQDKDQVTTHPPSSKGKKKSAKFTPRRDGPYIVKTQRSLTSYEVANPSNPDVPLGVYHTSALRPCFGFHENSRPVNPLRKRGRPRKS